MQEKENEFTGVDRALSARSAVIHRLLESDVPPLVKLMLVVGVIVIANYSPWLGQVLSPSPTNT